IILMPPNKNNYMWLMDIIFKTKKFQKLCNSEVELIKKFGKTCARKIRARLDDLQAAETLEALRTLPGRCHGLKGDRKNQLSLDVEQPLRLIFEPSNLDIKRKNDGGLDWSSVNEIRVIGVEDTHD
ncbi:TPA: type II toxin-antitoxin system RelE/ParE family toxin, partial [Legionella pneumophila]